jgi:hypothetical protein
MAFDELSEIGIVQFVERQRALKSLWGFVHIPKTAGMSLISAMSDACGPHRKISAESYLVGMDEFSASLWNAVREFVDVQRFGIKEHYKSFSGHIRRVHTDYIRGEIPEVRMFAMLRDPAKRVVSDYRYCLTPAHPPHEEFLRRFPTLMDYVVDRRYQNIMTKCLAPSPDMNPEEVIKSITTHFDFIGITEMFEFSVTAIFRMMGLSSPTVERLNVTTATARNALEVDSQVMEAIRRINHLDHALYRHVHAVLSSQREAWWAHVRSQLKGIQGIN